MPVITFTNCATGTLQRGRARVSAEIRLQRVLLVLQRLASTGPRSGERGNQLIQSRDQFPRLEASTGPRSGERGNPGALLQLTGAADPLQRGRARVSAEITALWLMPATCEALQRGRARVSAEMVDVEVHKPRCRNASTGPRSGERGNDRGEWENFSSWFCFNGAALG